MEEAVDADRIVVMEHGKIAKDSSGRLMDDTPREIFSRVEDLKRLQLTVPVITELGHELKQAGIPLPDGILTRDEFVQELKKLRK